MVAESKRTLGPRSTEASSPHPGRRNLLWFRRQLRIHDQPLFEPLDPSRDEVIAIWILDPREHLDVVQDFGRAGVHRLRFLLESVRALEASLRRRDVGLVVRIGSPEDVLPEVCRELAIDRLCLVEEPGTEERSIERRLRDRTTTDLQALPPETLLALNDPRRFARDLPEVFSSFRRTAEQGIELAPPRPTPSRLRPLATPPSFDCGGVPELETLGLEDEPRDPRSVLDFEGGEPAGLERMRDWMFTGDHLKNYKVTRNGMLGEDYSSKFSPWLALGALSPRLVAAETLRYEAERVANESTYWLRFELLWREYFRLHLLKHGPALFRVEGPAGRVMPWTHDDRGFEAWRSGTTGIPLIDANLRELRSTGFMSNRGRQVVASFLAKNLGIDWRWGARWFEHCLIDYCPAANWGNWAYAAGVGADPRGFRGFDVARQARNYDADGRYVAHWLPELQDLPGSTRHAPWQAGGPRPIVDPARSLEAARRRWESAEDSGPSGPPVGNPSRRRRNRRSR